MSALVRTASDTLVSDNLVGEEVKPAMACRTLRADSQPAPGGRVLPGGSPRGPRADLLAGKVDLRLSGVLRAAVRTAAKSQGLTDSAFIRTLIADHFGAEAAADRASGRRIPSELAQRVAQAVREIGAAYAPLSAQRPDVAEVKERLGAARQALLAVMKEESRS